MSDEIIKRDANFVTVLAGVTDDVDQDIEMLRVDPITKRLLVTSSIPGGFVSSINGLTGAVILAAGSNITLTPSGNTITIAATSSGTIGGSIANTQIAVGSGINTISGSSDFTWTTSVLTTNTDITLGHVGGPTGRTIKVAQGGANSGGSPLNILAGDGNGTATNGGNLLWTPGKAGSGGSNGNFGIIDPSTLNQALLFTNLLTTGHSYTFPDKSGTFAMLSDASLTSTRIAFGSSTNTITDSAAFTFDSTAILQTITHDAIGVVATDAMLLQNTTLASLAIPVQISPALEFKGHMWQSSGGGTDHNGTFRIYQIPKNGSNAPTTTAGTLQIDSSKDGSYTTNIFSLDKAGNITNAGTLTSANGITSTNGNITSIASSVSAGTNLLAGATGVATGALYLIGGTSGQVVITIPAATVTYTLTLPGAQGSAGSFWQNDGAGVLSNNRILTRVVGMADATSFTPNGDTSDIATQTNTQTAGVLTGNAPTGTPVDGQLLMLRFQCTNIQTFSWDAIYAGCTTTALPTATTGASKTDKFFFQYSTLSSKWEIYNAEYSYS